MATFLQTEDAQDVYTFVQYSSTASALQTALNGALGGTTVQCFADAANAGNALVVHNSGTVFSVPASSYVGYNRGKWEVKTAAKMAGGVNTDYTPFTP